MFAATVASVAVVHITAFSIGIQLVSIPARAISRRDSACLRTSADIVIAVIEIACFSIAVQNIAGPTAASTGW